MLKKVYVVELESSHILCGYTNYEKGVCNVDKSEKGIVVKFPISDGDSPAKLFTYIVSEDKVFKSHHDAYEYLKRIGG